MRLKGRQLRFLIATLGGWSGLRATLLLWPGAGVPLTVGHALASFTTAQAAVRSDAGADRRSGVPTRPVRPTSDIPANDGTSLPHMPGLDAVRPTLAAAPHADPRKASTRVGEQPIIAVPAPVARSQGASRWTGEAALFVRSGSGSAALAAGGQLGGSQAYARLTYRLNAAGPVRLAVAARVYRPLAVKGGEAAVGLDWHPLPAIPLRVSIERRVALDAQGRDAWSAYAAGGFYAGHLPLGVEADGYAQAGVVGMRRRDLFVDGAARAGYRVGGGPRRLILGAGIWGAAQPGVSRLDIGPRASLTLPVAGASVVLALEDRMRVAGHAHPGSGVAFTLAGAF